MFACASTLVQRTVKGCLGCSSDFFSTKKVSILDWSIEKTCITKQYHMRVCAESVMRLSARRLFIQQLYKLYYDMILLFVCEIIYLPPPQKWFLNGVRLTVVSDKKTDHSFGSTPNHQNGRGSRSFSTRPPCGQVRRWQQKLRPARLFARRSPRHAAARLPATVVYRSEMTDSATHSWSFYVSDARPHRRTAVKSFNEAPDLVWVIESD